MELLTLQRSKAPDAVGKLWRCSASLRNLRRARAVVKLGSRPVGLAEAVLGEINVLRPQRGGVKAGIVSKAVGLGLSGDRMSERLETGAANAWEERDWVRSDLLALSGRRRADLSNPIRSRKVVDDLEGFYEAAAKLIEHARAHEVVPDNARLLRALGSMGRIMQADGKVEFRGDAHAQRFADELRQRYGKGIVAELASGRTDALAGEFEDADQRKWIARAVVSAAKSHVAFGLTLKEARHAERSLSDRIDRQAKTDWE